MFSVPPGGDTDEVGFCRPPITAFGSLYVGRAIAAAFDGLLIGQRSTPLHCQRTLT